jgi:hypothetical protein
MQIDVSIYVSFVTGILLPFLIAYIRSRYASSQFAALLTFGAGLSAWPAAEWSRLRTPLPARCDRRHHDRLADFQPSLSAIGLDG